MAVFAAGGTAIWTLRRNALASAEQTTATLGVVLADQTTRSIQSVDLVLREAQLRVADLGLRTPDEFRQAMAGEQVHTYLASRSRDLPQAEVITLFDADGMLLNWSQAQPSPRVDFSGSDYFLHLSSEDDHAVYVSHPRPGGVSGHWVMIIARRIDGPDGRFLGLAAAVISATNLEDFYHTVSLPPGQSIALLHRDGIVILGQPDIGSRRGMHLPVRSPWYERVQEGGGSYRSDGELAGVPTIVTVHPLREYPLVIDVSISQRAALKDWRHDVIGIVIARGSVAVGCVVLFGVIAAQIRRAQEQNARLRQRESALRKSERTLKAFAEMSADWFWEQDADLRFVRDSKIPLTTLPSDIGKTRWECADPAMDPHRWETHKADLAARRSFRDFRWERIQIDGKRRYMSTSGDPIFDETGRFMGYHGTGRDITADVEAAEELRRSKDQAEAASRAKSEFLANMSHELRTPLNAIIGFAELVRDQARGKHADWADEILSGGRHLLNVINGVLELSRLEAGRYSLADNRVDLAVTARACLGMIRLAADKGGVQLRSAMAAGDIVLRADLQAVKQILINLVDNAVKFTPPGGSVSIYAVRTANGDIVLSVSDTGIGIDAAVLGSLCESFTQADASISRRFGGSGLGLAISRKLAMLHGGTLTIESVPRRGTTVRVTFPAGRVITHPQQAFVGGS